MRSLRKTWPLALMSLIVLALGACDGGDTEGTTNDWQTERQEALAEMDRELEQVDRKLQQIGDRIENAGAEAEAELEQTYAELKDKRERIAASLDEARNATEDRWDTIHGDIKMSLKEFSGDVERTWNDLGL